MELAQITNIALIVLLIFPAYSFIRTLYITYTNDMIGKMLLNLVVFVGSFVLFIFLYQWLWLPNQEEASLINHIIKLSTVLTFVPSVIINFKSTVINNSFEEGFKDAGE